MISKDLADGTKMGLDASGIIKRIGPKVTLVTTGDRVATLFNGTFRSIICTHESLVVKLPDIMSMEDGASLPAAYATAYQALCEAGRLASGETVLIHSAVGGLLCPGSSIQRIICTSQLTI